MAGAKIPRDKPSPGRSGDTITVPEGFTPEQTARKMAKALKDMGGYKVKLTKTKEGWDVNAEPIKRRPYKNKVK